MKILSLFFTSFLSIIIISSKILSVQITEINTAIPMICYEPWFSKIKHGEKPVEGRKNSSKYRDIQTGDIIEFVNEHDEKFKTIVTEVRRYTSLDAYLSDVTYEKAVPGTRSLDEAIKIYHQYSTPAEIAQHGFMGIFITPLSPHATIHHVTIMPQEEIGLHYDEFAQIVVARKGGIITRLEADGTKTEVNFPTGKAILRPAETPDKMHKSINDSSESIELIIVQLK